MKYQQTSAGTVFSIMGAALVFGLAVGFPCGYIAHQSAAQTAGANLALSQK